MPIMPREIVIADGAVAAFIRHTVRYESFSAARMHDVSLLVLDPRQRKSLTNVIDQHSSENYDNDIYYIYTLMERSELPAGASVAASRRELENIIF